MLHFVILVTYELVMIIRETMQSKIVCMGKAA